MGGNRESQSKSKSDQRKGEEVVSKNKTGEHLWI